MSTKELTKAVRRLRELEAEAAQLGGEIDALKEQIKAEMTARDVDEMQAGVFRVRAAAQCQGACPAAPGDREPLCRLCG